MQSPPSRSDQPSGTILNVLGRMGRPGGQRLNRIQECTLAAMKANSTVKRNTDNGLSGSDGEVIISPYVALVRLHVEYDAQFGGLR